MSSAGYCSHSPKGQQHKTRGGRSYRPRLAGRLGLSNKMKTARKAKIITVVGARPNFMKAAPILAAIRDHNDGLIASPGTTAEARNGIEFESVLVHTGQHYDEAMSDWFFADLNIPKPDVHLGAGSGSHAFQTAEIMKRFEDVVLRERPDVLVVVGDVNSTVACALVAAKISFDSRGSRPIIAHVEAGLRSFDRCMPEEINRILTDHLSDLLFVTEESGVRNLLGEGIPKAKIHFVGNTMIDSLLACRERAGQSAILAKLGLRNGNAKRGGGNGSVPYALLTLHRPSNVDSQKDFQRILEGLDELKHSCAVIFPAHPRTHKRIIDFGLEQFFHRCEASGTEALTADGAKGKILLVDPLGYLDFLCLMQHAAIVITDSGGIQEETTSLGVPCVTVRENTERPSTIEVGTNVLAGTTSAGIREATRVQLRRETAGGVPERWDGRSAQRILDVIVQEVAKTRTPPLNSELQAELVRPV
jgi:UDP-N-acetylglucosamine 2-epimerase (non-hydrolysing)